MRVIQDTILAIVHVFLVKYLWGCEKMRFHFSQPTFFLKLKFTGLKRVHFPFPQNEHRFCYHAAFWRRICLL